MALKRKITKEEFEALPEVLQAEYAEKDGDYFIQVEGMVAKERLDEFRDNNIDLKKKMSELEGRLDGFGDITPEEIADLKAKATDNKGNFDEDAFQQKLEAEIKKRTGKMSEEHQKQVDELMSSLSKANGQLSTLVIDNAIADAAMKSGVHETALTDIKLRARQVFKVQDGKAVPYDGEDVIYGADGTTPLGIDEWMKDMEKVSPHWFKPSQGGGSQSHERGKQPSGAGNKDARGLDRMRAARAN